MLSRYFLKVQISRFPPSGLILNILNLIFYILASASQMCQSSNLTTPLHDATSESTTLQCSVSILESASQLSLPSFRNWKYQAHSYQASNMEYTHWSGLAHPSSSIYVVWDSSAWILNVDLASGLVSYCLARTSDLAYSSHGTSPCDQALYVMRVFWELSYDCVHLSVVWN